MITTAQIVETLREYNGETDRQTEARIVKAAERLGLAPVEAFPSGRLGHHAWHDAIWADDDADEICMAITR